MLKLAKNALRYQTATLRDLDMKLKGIREFLDEIDNIEKNKK